MRSLKKESWPHVIKLGRKQDTNIDTSSKETWLAKETWLVETIGCFKDRWNVVYHLHGVDYYFKDSDDAVMFALKWL